MQDSTHVLQSLYLLSLPHLYYLPLVNDFVSEFETAAYGLGEGGSTSDAGNLLSNADASISTSVL